MQTYYNYSGIDANDSINTAQYIVFHNYELHIYNTFYGLQLS
jgi:hypothetical protein